MPRSPRADEAGGLYHVLNRANRRLPIFHKKGDYAAFEQVLHDALQIHQIELYAYQLMPNHWHLVLRPLVDGEMGRFCGWIGSTHTLRYNTHYQTLGEGHLYQGRFKSFPIQDDAHFLAACRYVERNAKRAKLVRQAEKWQWGSLWRWLQKTEPNPKLLSGWPISRTSRWVDHVNRALGEKELKALRRSVQRGTPLGDEGWVKSIACRLNLESTLRPRGRPRVRFLTEDQNKDP